MSRPATMAEADAFCSHLERKFHSFVVPSAVISVAFQAMLGLDPMRFVTASGITVGPLIWMSTGLTPDQRISTMCHETQHVVIQNREGLTTNWYHYLASGEERVRIESECYRAGELELHHARWGNIPSLENLVTPMRHGYLLSDDDITLSRDLLEAAATSVSASPPVYCTEAAIESIAWMRMHASELLAP